ncbi:thiolase-like protein [Xylaria longipes]|nr:thiolase-like protein [Xylaria longipes]
MTIRGACSSSLIALNEACTSIARGEYESAIVGGTNIIEATSLTVASSKHGALSSDDSFKTFSSEANGYARGEGVVVLHLKSLKHARRNGNSIDTDIVDTATNCDGKTLRFSVPSTAAQEAFIWFMYKLIPRMNC